MFRLWIKYSAFIFTLLFIVSCGISEEEIVELAKEKNISKLSTIIDEEYQKYLTEIEREDKEQTKKILLTALNEGMKNHLVQIKIKAEELYWKDNTLDREILINFNKNQITLEQKEKFLEKYYYNLFNKQYRNNEYEIYNNQLKLIDNKILTSFYKTKIKKSFYNKDWDKVVLFYKSLTKIVPDTLNYNKNISDLVEIQLFGDAINHDRYATISEKYSDLDNKYNEISENISSISSDLQSKKDELEESEIASEDIYARIYDFQQKTFNVKAYLVDGIGNNEYEIAFSDGRGILKMNDHMYKYKGFIEILTYPIGYRTVSLKNGYTAQLQVYEEVPDQDKLYYYEDLERASNVSAEISKLKYSINILEAKISAWESKQAYYDKLISKLKDEIKVAYEKMQKSLGERILPLTTLD